VSNCAQTRQELDYRLLLVPTLGEKAMKRAIITLMLLGGFTALCTLEASAAVCAVGVYRAGCVGVRGAAVVHRPLYGAAVVHRPLYGRRVIRR
jgi:hypothetical protein